MNQTKEDRLMALVQTLEECCPPLDDLKMFAFRSGLLEAAGHLMDPGINTLAVAHRQGFDFLCIQFDRKCEARMRKPFDAGFTSLLVLADVPLDQMRGKVRGWR
jgi:hypothetical protein